MFEMLSPSDVAVICLLIVGLGMVIRIFWLLARSLEKVRLGPNGSRSESAKLLQTLKLR